MRGSKVVVAVFSLIVMSTTANAANLYVSLSGNNANAGTQAAPFRTLNWAGVKAQPGDVIYVRGGVYNETVNIMAKGTATAPITIQSYPGETAVYDGSGLNANVLFSVNQTQYVNVSGFEVRNASNIAVSLWMTKNTKFLNSTVHNARRNGIYAGYDSPGVSADVTIEGNTVYNCVLENTAHAMQGGWASTVSIHHTERARVAGNRVYNNDGEAIAVILSNNVTVTGNETFDNYSQGVYLDNSRFNTVDGNLIYSTGNTRYFRDGYPGMGIAIANEFYDYSNPSTDNKIINNIIINTRWGFLYGNFELGGGLKNTTIANNTFYKSSQAMIEIWQDPHSNSVVENNIFHQAGGTAVATLQGSGVTFRNNHWYGGTPTGATAGSGDVYGNTAFVNPGGFRAADYKLTASSMAIAKALPSSVVKTDYFGTTRVAPLDMGAHQFSTGGAVADTQAPSAPANLRPVSGDSARIDIAWNAAADNVGVSAYIVKRNGATIATVGSTTFSDTSVVSGTKYTYQVIARDAAGNQSAGSNAVDLAFDNSSAQTGSDKEAPSAPAALRAGTVTSNSVQLIWNAATDNVGVTNYKIYRNGMLAKMVSDITMMTDGGRAAGKTYRYHVVALDAAGNVSARSDMIEVKTKNTRQRAVR
ncbi:MAG TPA: right-handed parallel beta-helix repeat-containing protein [Thermoanaerobaculia bacterium]|nr:right-handed parallel beta-helix repeat-containing protein [Thermoanaerobaculia bacterium]